MRDFEAWLRQYRAAVEEVFGERIVCIGLQGSRGRGEAGTASDIDMVLILDDVSAEDLLSYRAAVKSLPERELLCGFVSGRVELEHWNPGELFQFYHDTRPLAGDLEFLRPMAGQEAAALAVRDGACALYHGCAHNLLHGRSREALGELYKAAGFTLRAKYFVETKTYLARQSDLLSGLRGEDHDLLMEGIALRSCPNLDDREFDRLSGKLGEWAGALLATCVSKKFPV